MTPDEREMLSDLAKKVAQTPPPPKDAEAEEFIRSQIGRRPDALYVMTQTVLIQNMALEQAQEQIQDLQRQLQTASQPRSSGGSFLGGAQPAMQGGGYQQSGYAPPPPQYAPAPQYASAPAPSGAPSFLRGAAQTAAGVAAGALAFEGIRSMFSHPGFGGGNEFGGFGGGPNLGPGMTPEIVNNYYDSDSPHQERNEYRGGGSDVRADDSDLSSADTDDSTAADVNNADDFDYSASDDDFGDSGSDDNS
jgi:uncharacterized protein